MTQKGFAAFSFILLFLLLACSQEEKPLAVDLSKRAESPPKSEGPVITYAYLPQYSHSVSYQRHNPLIQYLIKETGLPVIQIFPDTFDEHMKMVGQGKIDISFSNPVAYVKMAHRYGALAFASVVEQDGKPRFRGQIICRADNRSITTVEDCRGKRWIAVDPSSAGGYLFALGYFFDHGIRKRDFAEIAFAPGPGGKQEKVVLAVHAGRYDIGSIREGTLNLMADKIDVSEMRVIAHTPWYPGWVYAARKGLDDDIVKRIQAALVRLNRNQPEHRTILDAAHFNGVVTASHNDFEPLRELLSKVGMDREEQ
ncbi:MAG: phosphate/phosphite/phosphonate ABC transporter substrate-binding protein [Chloroflexota bacterium]